MKKRFLMIIGVIVAFAAVSVIAASVLSYDDFLDENVEALLSGESVSGVIECVARYGFISNFAWVSVERHIEKGRL